jgi:hypothetical protein
MQTLFSAIAAGAGALGLGYAIVARRSARLRFRDAGVGPIFLFALISVVVLFLFTLPEQPPFSPGMTLGLGFLIGGGLGILMLMFSLGERGDEPGVARPVLILSAAALGPSLVLLAFRGYPNDALVGCALGAVLVACISSAMLRPVEAASPVDFPKNLPYRDVEVFALATTVLAVAARLGIARFPRPSLDAIAGGYWAAPALLLAAGALALVLLPAGKQRSTSAVIASLLILVGAAALSYRLLPDFSWTIPLYGAVVFGFLWWILVPEQDDSESRPAALALGTGLLALALAALAFREMQGYGQALALVPASLLTAVAVAGHARGSRSIAPRLMKGALSVILLLTLLRVYWETLGRTRILDFQQQYDVFSLLFGIAACFGIMAFISRQSREGLPAESGSWLPAIMRTLLLGFFIVAAPLVLAVLWGPRSTAAFITGTVAGQLIWMMLIAWTAGRERRVTLACGPHIFFVASALVAIQFTPLVLDLGLTQMHRIVIVAVAGVVALLWLGADGASELRSRRTEARNERA